MRAAGVTLVLMMALALPRKADAYIDPGTGSLIIQGLIAGFAAAAMILRSYWYRIKAFLRRDKVAPPPDTESKPPGEPE